MRKAIENQTVEQWVEWLKNFKNHKTKLSLAENLALRNAIIAYTKVADEFFCHTLYSLYLGLAARASARYGVMLEICNIAACIYLGMFESGKWTRLKSYTGGENKDCSIFSWVSKGAAQIIFNELKEQGFIDMGGALTAKNTDLTLDSMHRHPEELDIVLDLVQIPELHQVLTYLYVERLGKEKIMEKMHITEEKDYKNLVNRAETQLKENLLDTDIILFKRPNGKVVNLVRLAISDRRGCLSTNTSDEAMMMADRYIPEGIEYGGLHEVLEQFYPGLPFIEQWHQFVLDRAAEMAWNEEERFIFIEHFSKCSSHLSIARMLQRSSGWVYTKKSRLIKELIRYIKTWLGGHVN